MDEQIELIARAVFEAHNATYTIGGPAKWESDPEHWRRYARAAHSVMVGKVAELGAEIARLRNISNEDGLVDDELAKIAGKPMDAVKASVLEPRAFDAALAPHPKGME